MRVRACVRCVCHRGWWGSSPACGWARAACLCVSLHDKVELFAVSESFALMRAHTHINIQTHTHTRVADWGGGMWLSGGRNRSGNSVALKAHTYPQKKYIYTQEMYVFVQIHIVIQIDLTF